eukprot:7390065-Prymnesium_polylepis.1
MSGWDFLESNNKRIGARVIENAKLRGPGHLGLDSVDGRNVTRRTSTRTEHGSWCAHGRQKLRTLSCMSIGVRASYDRQTGHLLLPDQF